jgi:pimeloyl-ACP methyl ester carboxylesterase
MQNCLVARVSYFFVLALVIVWLNNSPLQAQTSGNGPKLYTASYATQFARYYAPYALQAASAYVDKVAMDATLGPSGQAPIDGSDVRVAVNYIFQDQPDETLAARARGYLRSWQYQFGSEGYLGCFGQTGNDCYSWNDWLKFATSGGPAFQVWARTRYPQKQGSACSEVSIAFRGTTLSTADWIANLDRATGYVYDDHYRQLRRNIDAIIKKIATLDCYKLRIASTSKPPQIVSVGHSLGGGLAQLAGLADRRVAKVFAFDSSPVTGASYVDKQTRLGNAEDLAIDRIYQSGEVLQKLKRLQQFPYYGSKCVRYVAFDVLQPDGPVTLHNMAGLAREVVRLSYVHDPRDPYAIPSSLPNCANSRYTAPLTDEDEDVVAKTRFPSGRRADVHSPNNLVFRQVELQTQTFELFPQPRTLDLAQRPQSRHVSRLTIQKRRFGSVRRDAAL